MGRNSGGNRGGGNRGVVSTKESVAVRNIEMGIRNNKFETGVVIDKNGNEILRVKGKRYKVEYSVNDIIKMKDNILTHNHPYAVGKKGVLSIGTSFSREDIDAAIVADVKEIRAVTPKYTFSLKRPKGGWGVSRYEMYSKYREVNSRVQKKLVSYIVDNKFSNVSKERAMVLESHLTIKELAKYYGWGYSKRKG